MSEEHNFNRTVCACENCKACCKRQPGPLAPNDFDRIVMWFIGKGMPYREAFAYVKDRLWASPGCVVKMRDTGEVRRVGTITPRYKKGRCVFLDEHDRCSIHQVAPFGCAFFDTHMGPVEASRRGQWLAHEQMTNKDYQKLRDELPYASHHKPLKYDL